MGLAFAPDGRTVASSAWDGSLTLWNATERRPAIASIKEHEPGNANPTLFAVAHTPDGKAIASSGDIAPIRLRDARTLAELGAIESRLRVLALTFSHDGRWLAAAGVQGLEIFDYPARRRVASLDANSEQLDPLGLVFSPDGRLLASGHEPGAIQIYSVPDFVKIRSLPSGVESTRGLAFSPDGSFLAAGARDVSIWSTRNWTPVVSLTNLPGSTRSVAFSPDGRTLAGAGTAGVIHLWNTTDWSSAAAFRGHAAEITRLAFSPEGSTMASASYDGTVRLWPGHAGEHSRESTAFPPESSRYWRTQTISADGRTLATPQTNLTTLELWDVATLTPIGQYTLPLHQRFLTNWSSDVLTARREKAASAQNRIFVSLDIDSARQRVALGDVRGALVIRHLEGTTPETTLRHNGDVVDLVAFSRDGRRIANTSWDGTLQVHEVETGRELLRESIVPQLSSMALTLSTDGNLIASGDYNGAIRLCDITGRLPSRWLRGHAIQVRALAFTPEGTTLISSAYDRSVRLWDVRTGQTIHEIPGEDYSGLAISPDGTRLAVAYKESVGLWDIQTRLQVGLLKSGIADLRRVTFPLGGDSLAAIAADGLRIWHAPPFAARSRTTGQQEQTDFEARGDLPSPNRHRQPAP